MFPRESGHCTVTYGRAAQAERKIKLFVLAKGEKEQTFGYISCVPVKMLDIFISFYLFLHSTSLRLIANIARVPVGAEWCWTSEVRHPGHTHSDGDWPGRDLSTVLWSFCHMALGIPLVWHSVQNQKGRRLGSELFDQKWEDEWLINAIYLEYKIFPKGGSWIEVGGFNGVFRGKVGCLVLLWIIHSWRRAGHIWGQRLRGRVSGWARALASSLSCHIFYFNCHLGFLNTDVI